MHFVTCYFVSCSCGVMVAVVVYFTSQYLIFLIIWLVEMVFLKENYSLKQYCICPGHIGGRYGEKVFVKNVGFLVSALVLTIGNR